MKTMMFNPFTGWPRDPRDIATDPAGILICDGEEPLRPSAMTQGGDHVGAAQWQQQPQQLVASTPPDSGQSEPVACPYCALPSSLGAVYYDQNCAGCTKRSPHPSPAAGYVPMTDEEIAEIRNGTYRPIVGFRDYVPQDYPLWCDEFARAIECAVLQRIGGRK